MTIIFFYHTLQRPEITFHWDLLNLPYNTHYFVVLCRLLYLFTVRQVAMLLQIGEIIHDQKAIYGLVYYIVYINIFLHFVLTTVTNSIKNNLHFIKYFFQKFLSLSTFIYIKKSEWPQLNMIIQIVLTEVFHHLSPTVLFVYMRLNFCFPLWLCAFCTTFLTRCLKII